MMNNLIDLKPYLPGAAPKKRHILQNIAAIIESVVTLCIGAGFLLFLAACFAIF